MANDPVIHRDLPPGVPVLGRLDRAAERVIDLLVGFIRCEAGRIGFTRAVLGLSGGIDSALSAALAAKALGPDNVTAVVMPYHTSNPQSEADAKAVADALGMELRRVDITPMVDAYFADQPDASALRRGNKMARERMSILYDHSAHLGALVIGTSNKTEILLGYGTQFGDLASAINPIGDLYKLQVYELAELLHLPGAVLEKAPSADLWEGQTDEQELGFSYDVADQVLYRLVDLRFSVAELIDLGFDEALLSAIEHRLRTSHYKRKPPIIAKVSQRTVGRDFLYSRDWGT